jgi:drug/metabolite transporter (DMT)-like permease
MTLRSAAGAVVGLAGLVVIYSEDLGALGGHDVALASVVMLGSPILSAISNILVKRYGKGIHPISLAAVPMALSAVVMGATAAVVERNAVVRWDAGPLVAVGYLALAGSALTFTLFYWLLSHSTAVKSSLIAYTTPIVAVAFGATFMNEVLTARIIAGGALVIAGVAGATWPASSRPITAGRQRS